MSRLHDSGRASSCSTAGVSWVCRQDASSIRSNLARRRATATRGLLPAGHAEHGMGSSTPAAAIQLACTL